MAGEYYMLQWNKNSSVLTGDSSVADAIPLRAVNFPDSLKNAPYYPVL